MVLTDIYKGKHILRPRQGEPLPKHDPIKARRRIDPDFDQACREFLDGAEESVGVKVLNARASEIRRDREAAEEAERQHQRDIELLTRQQREIEEKSYSGELGYTPRRFRDLYMAQWPVKESADDAQ